MRIANVSAKGSGLRMWFFTYWEVLVEVALGRGCESMMLGCCWSCSSCGSGSVSWTRLLGSWLIEEVSSLDMIYTSDHAKFGG